MGASQNCEVTRTVQLQRWAANMSIDIFEFWSGVHLRKGAHPADYHVLSRVKHNFDLRCLPGCFGGPLRTAPVVLLYLSPGLSIQDYAYAQTRVGRAHCRRKWGGEEPLPGPEDHEPAWKWWKSRTARFGEWQDLRTKVAVLNIGAYQHQDQDSVRSAGLGIRSCAPVGRCAKAACIHGIAFPAKRSRRYRRI